MPSIDVKIEALRKSAIMLGEMQDMGLPEVTWKPGLRAYYGLLRDYVCGSFRPWRDPKEPQYFHSLCGSGTDGKLWLAGRCATCPFLDSDVPGAAKAHVRQLQIAV